MLSLKMFALISQALPRCSVMVSAGDLLITDRNGEVVGAVNFESKSITVYREYTHAMKVTRRLKLASIPVELREQPAMEQAMKILYDH